ncbi:MAG: ferritin-like domain-containing protein [Polyangiaceae bacterium]
MRRVEAEYTSAAITHHLGLWLIQLGVTPDLIRLSLRIVDDEIAHAELSHETYVAAGGSQTPALVRERLGLTRSSTESLEADVARVCVDVFCLGETVAVPLFKNIREGCSVPVARTALDRILRDEVVHRGFGWTLLEWLLESPFGASTRDVVARELPVSFARIRASYASAGSRTLAEISDEDRAWGLMAPARYRDITLRTFEKEWAPRFSKLDIDAKSAWEASFAGAAH